MVWFKRLIIVTTVLALCVVVLGAYVRLADAGLGCPDWPGCYGELIVPESDEAILQAQQNYPGSIVEPSKAWKEMIHRYLAGILGLMIGIIAVISYKNKEHINVPIVLPLGLLVLVVFQAALGMWTVTELLKPIIVTAHLMGGMATLGLLVYLVHRHWGSVQSLINMNNRTRVIVRLSLLLLFFQILLGGWTSANYAALSCTDFPTCHGALIPEMDFLNGFTIFRELGMTVEGKGLSLQALHAIQWVHRVGAIILVTYFVFMAYILNAYPSLRLYRNILILVLIMQFLIGIANLLLHLPIVLATLHNLGAALLVIITVIINSRVNNTNG